MSANLRSCWVVRTYVQARTGAHLGKGNPALGDSLCSPVAHELGELVRVRDRARVRVMARAGAQGVGVRRGVTGLGRGGASVPSPPRSPCSSRPPRAPAPPARRYPGTPAHTRHLRVIGPGRGAWSGFASTHAKADRQLQAQALVPAWAQVRGSGSGFRLVTGNDAADEARVEHGILREGGRRRAEGGEVGACVGARAAHAQCACWRPASAWRDNRRRGPPRHPHPPAVECGGSWDVVRWSDAAAWSRCAPASASSRRPSPRAWL